MSQQATAHTTLEKVFLPHAYSHVVAIVNPKSGERQASDFVYSSLCDALSDTNKVYRLDAASFRDTTRMKELIKSYCVLFVERQEIVSTTEVAEARLTLGKQASVVEILSTNRIGSEDDLAENLGNRRPSSNLTSPKSAPKDPSKKAPPADTTPTAPSAKVADCSPSEYAAADRGTVVAAGGDGTVCFIMSVVDSVREELEALMAAERKGKVLDAVKRNAGSAPLTITIRTPIIPAIGVIAMGTGNDLSNSLGYGLGYTKYPAPPCCFLCCGPCLHVVKDILDSLVLKAVAVPFDRWQVTVTPIRELVTDVVSEAIYEEDEKEVKATEPSVVFTKSITLDASVGGTNLELPAHARRRTVSIAFDAAMMGHGAAMRSASALQMSDSLATSQSHNLRTLLDTQTSQPQGHGKDKKRTKISVDTQRYRTHHNEAERAGIFQDPAKDEHTLVMASSFYRFAKSSSSASASKLDPPQPYSPTGGDGGAGLSDSTAKGPNDDGRSHPNHCSSVSSPQTKLVVEERLPRKGSGMKATDNRRRKSILESIPTFEGAQSPNSPGSPIAILPNGSPASDPAAGPKPIRKFIAMNYFSLGMDAYIATTFDILRKKHPSLFNSRLMNKMWYGSLGLYGWAKSERLDDNIYFIDVATEEGVIEERGPSAIPPQQQLPLPLPLQQSPSESSAQPSHESTKADELMPARSSLEYPSTEDRHEMRTPTHAYQSTGSPLVAMLPPVPTPITFPPKTKCLVLSNVGSYSGGAKLWKTSTSEATKAADSRRALLDRIRRNHNNQKNRPAASNEGPDSQLDRPLMDNKHTHAASGGNTPTYGTVACDPFRGLSEENLALLNGAKGYEPVSTSDDRIEVQAVGGLMDMMMLQSKLTPTKPMAQSQVVRIVVGHPEHHPSKVAHRVAEAVAELRKKQEIVSKRSEKARKEAVKEYTAKAKKDTDAFTNSGKRRPELQTRYTNPMQRDALIAEHELALLAADKDLQAARARVDELQSLLEVAPDWAVGMGRFGDGSTNNGDVLSQLPVDTLRAQRPETLQEALATAIHSEVLPSLAKGVAPSRVGGGIALALNQTLSKSVCFQVDGEPSGYITEPTLIEVRPYPKQMLVRSLKGI